MTVPEIRQALLDELDASVQAGFDSSSPACRMLDRLYALAEQLPTARQATVADVRRAVRAELRRHRRFPTIDARV